MTKQPTAFRHVLRPLEEVGRNLRRFVLTEGVCRVFAVLVGVAFIQFALDRFLDLGSTTRAVVLAAVILAVGLEFRRRVLRPARVQVDANDVARLLEKRNPEYRDHLASAVAFASAPANNPHRNSPVMVQAMLEAAAERFGNLPTEGLLDRPRYRRFLGLGGAALAVTLAAFVLAPDTMATYLERNILLGDVPWPLSATIVPEGFEKGRLTHPIGDPLNVTARAVDGDVPDGLTAEFEYPSGERVLRGMDRLGDDRFNLKFGPLRQAMRLRFRLDTFGVDQRTAWYSIDAVHRPSVRSVRIRIQPPTYSEQAPFVLPDGQVSADLLRGSEVEIDAQMSKAVVEASLRLASATGPVASAVIHEGTRVTSRFVPQQRGTYFLGVEDETGLDDRFPVTYTFNLITDPPPKVRLELPGVGGMVVPNAILSLAVDCEDNLALKDVRFFHWKGGAGEEGKVAAVPIAEPLPNFTVRQQKYACEERWPLLPLTMKPGEQLTLVVRAEDFQPSQDTQVNRGESVAYTLKIVSAEELLADLGRREDEWRREFEQIIKAQEQINSRILDLRNTPPQDALSHQRTLRYRQEARTQRQQAGRLRTVTRQFEQILSEMRVNQLATPSIRRRLAEGVIAPLKKLTNTHVPSAAALIEELRVTPEIATADELERLQTKIVRTMYAILAQMLEWEGYNEAVSLLRDIVRLQTDINQDTEARLAREIEKLFGSDSEPRPESGSKSESGTETPP